MNRKGFRDPRFEDLAAYALGALTPGERREVDALLERSEEARLELAGYEDAAAAFSAGAPDVEMPAGMRDRLLSKLDAASRQPSTATANGSSGQSDIPAAGRAPLRAVARPVWPGRIALGASGAAIAAAIALAVTFGMRTSGLQSDLNRVTRDLDTVSAALDQERASVDQVEASMAALKTELTAASEQNGMQQAEVSRLAAANQVLQEAVKDQRWLTYVTFNRNWETTSWLRPSPDAPDAQGQMVVNPSGDSAVLFVDGMPVLPEGLHYKLWLSGTGWRWPAASFLVDDNGYARLDLSLPAGVNSFTTASVTREPDPGIDSLPIEVLSAPSSR